jgi:diguanylate cyclase (GGDEF)-like protein
LNVDLETSERTNARVLRWQARWRCAAAVVLGGFELLLQQGGALHGSEMWVAGSVAAYIAVVQLLDWHVRRQESAGNWTIGATIFADLLFIFVSTAACSPASSYDRILILSFFELHLTESFFGRTHATLALLAVVAGYLALAWQASLRGAAVVGPEELWSVALFATAGLMFIAQYGSFQRRLEHVVELFEWAEDGDFTRVYDVREDKHPGAITRVGRAYNRVRVQLASMVLIDPLTGCLNRRGLDQTLARELARATRAGSTVSLLALDLDHFKNVNDNYGHIAGDAVLREFGALLKQTARGGDMVARTGGEEFTILLPDTDPEGALHTATRMCDTVRSHQFMVNGKRLYLTISVGLVSMARVGSDAASANLKERADEALYAAKRAGRDRVRVWDDQIALTRTPPYGLSHTVGVGD